MAGNRLHLTVFVRPLTEVMLANPTNSRASFLRTGPSLTKTAIFRPFGSQLTDTTYLKGDKLKIYQSTRKEN